MTSAALQVSQVRLSHLREAEDLKPEIRAARPKIFEEKNAKKCFPPAHAAVDDSYRFPPARIPNESYPILVLGVGFFGTETMQIHY